MSVSGASLLSCTILDSSSSACIFAARLTGKLGRGCEGDETNVTGGNLVVISPAEPVTGLSGMAGSVSVSGSEAVFFFEYCGRVNGNALELWLVL